MCSKIQFLTASKIWFLPEMAVIIFTIGPQFISLVEVVDLC